MELSGPLVFSLTHVLCSTALVFPFGGHPWSYKTCCKQTRRRRSKMRKAVLIYVLLAMLVLVVACAAPPPAPVPTAAPVVVKETVVVAGTPQVVERVVTATPAPAAPTT